MDKYYIKNFTNSYHSGLSPGWTIVESFANDTINKIDSRKLYGLENNTKLKELLVKSDWDTQRAKAGETLSKNGFTAIAPIIEDGELRVKFLLPTSIQSYGRKVIRGYFQTQETKLIDNITYHGYFFWYLKEAPITKKVKPVLESFFYAGENVTQFIDGMKKERQYLKSPKPVKKWDYKKQGLPIAIISNNPQSRPDWYNVSNILNEANKVSNDMFNELEKGKIIIEENASFSKGVGDVIDKTRDIKNGGDSISHTSFNGESGMSTAFSAIGGVSLQMYVSTLSYLEDRAFKYANKGRDMDGSGTNKHTTQVNMFNQTHSEQVITMKEQRERDYLHFFNEVLNYFVNTSTKVESLSFDETPIEKSKTFSADEIEAVIEEKLASARAKEADAALKKAQAKTVGESTPPNKETMV